MLDWCPGLDHHSGIREIARAQQRCPPGASQSRFHSETIVGVQMGLPGEQALLPGLLKGHL